MSQVINGDCFKVLGELEPDSVDLVVTSPPYWGLRDYGEFGIKIWGAILNVAMYGSLLHLLDGEVRTILRILTLNRQPLEVPTTMRRRVASVGSAGHGAGNLV